MTTLTLRLDVEDLAAASRSGPVLALAAYSVFQLMATFLADVGATSLALASVGAARPLREVFWMRGATYLVGVLNFTIGQGAVALHFIRRGRAASEAAGIALTVVLTSFLALATMAIPGILSFLALGEYEKVSLVLIAALPIVAAVLIHSKPPQILARLASLRPFFRTPLSRHATALLARGVFVAILSILHWGALAVWGVALPFQDAAALIPVFLFLVALPLTPNGLGTGQLLQIVLFSPYASSANSLGSETSVLAFGLLQYGMLMSLQTALGLYCFRRWRREFYR